MATFKFAMQKKNHAMVEWKFCLGMRAQWEDRWSQGPMGMWDVTRR